jgi:hypothetical protein
MTEPRKTFLDFETQGRKFRIRKFDAMNGCYIIYQLMGSSLPSMFGAAVKKELADQGLEAMMPTATVMDKKSFQDIQKSCLQVCFEILPAGEKKVLNDNGTWGVLDIEDNTPLVFALTVKALVFNVADFFGSGVLGDLAVIFQDLFQSKLIGQLLSSGGPSSPGSGSNASYGTEPTI